MNLKQESHNLTFFSSIHPRLGFHNDEKPSQLSSTEEKPVLPSPRVVALFGLFLLLYLLPLLTNYFIPKSTFTTRQARPIKKWTTLFLFDYSVFSAMQSAIWRFLEHILHDCYGTSTYTRAVKCLSYLQCIDTGRHTPFGKTRADWQISLWQDIF